MFRWLAVCLILGAGTFALVYALVNPGNLVNNYVFGNSHPNATTKDPVPDKENPGSNRKADAAQAKEEQSSSPAGTQLDTVLLLKEGASGPRSLVIPEARLLVHEKQDVPSERDGKLIVLGTELSPTEVKFLTDQKALGKKMPPWFQEAPFARLLVEINPGETVPPDQVITKGGRFYRPWKENDNLEPKKFLVEMQPRYFHKLEVGQPITKGQVIALVNPVLALDDLKIKAAKLEAAEADRIASVKTKEEAEKRYNSMTESRRRAPGSVSDDDYRGAKLTWDRYVSEEISKDAAKEQAKRELSGSVTQLNMHEIRAEASGVVKNILKSRGDAVKNLETVLQIQNKDWIMVEGKVEVQNARTIKPDMEVIIEPSRPEAPTQVLVGHLQEVTCVAVSNGQTPVVVSGSLDKTLRGWDPVSGQSRWILNHRAAVRSVSCTPAGAKRNLVLFGAADGSVHLLDLDHIDQAPQELEPGEAAHHKPVTSVAFSPDGTLCAAGSEDLSIRLWDVDTGKNLVDKPKTHRSPVASLQFLARKPGADGAETLNLVSVDRGVVNLWNVERTAGSAMLGLVRSVDRHNSNLLHLSANGSRVLFDQGNELVIRSLETNQIEGILTNTGTTNFSNLALFAPDGNTILTNSGSEGKLQLWRTPTRDRRGSELRQFIWTSGAPTCGAFDPRGQFAVTGTRDNNVLVWTMPTKEEIEKRLVGRILGVEPFQDSDSRQVRIWAELDNPGWLIPGTTATMEVLPNQGQPQR